MRSASSGSASMTSDTASALRASGADVAAHLGHSTTTGTRFAERYAPVVPDKLRHAIDRL